jgi:broad specificity phosphatase PhoE
MTITNFWIIRHALVEENARTFHYGAMDVPLCEDTILEQAPMYRALARRLPRPAIWRVSPLSRTRRTAEAIFAAGYPAEPLTADPGLIEQHFGDWQGTPHDDLAEKLTHGPHPFWPVVGHERPPGGESMADVLTRVGATLERLAEEHEGQDVVIVSHGGAIRAAIGHALGVPVDHALHISVQNLSLTRLERQSIGWRVVCVNELPGY